MPLLKLPIGHDLKIGEEITIRLLQIRYDEIRVCVDLPAEMAIRVEFPVESVKTNDLTD